jgi:hypothetical protein
MAKLRNEEPYLLKRYRIVFWVLMVAGVAYVVYHWTDRHRTERIVAEKPEYAVGRITGHFEHSTGGGRYNALPRGTVPWINYTFTTKEGMTYTGKWVARQYGESPVGDTITIAYNADRPRRNKPAFIDWFKFK